jgi:hypothetical protein
MATLAVRGSGNLKGLFDVTTLRAPRSHNCSSEIISQAPDANTAIEVLLKRKTTLTTYSIKALIEKCHDAALRALLVEAASSKGCLDRFSLNAHLKALMDLGQAEEALRVASQYFEKTNACTFTHIMEKETADDVVTLAIQRSCLTPAVLSAYLREKPNCTFDEAWSLWKQVNGQSETQGVLLARLIRLAGTAKRYDKALELIEFACDHKRCDPYVFGSFAQAARECHHGKEALTALKRAAELKHVNRIVITNTLLALRNSEDSSFTAANIASVFDIAEQIGIAGDAEILEPLIGACGALEYIAGVLWYYHFALNRAYVDERLFATAIEAARRCKAFAQAKKMFNEAKARDLLGPYSCNNTITVARDSDDFELAQLAFRSCDPTVEIYTNMIAACRVCRKEDEGHRIFEQAIDAHPQNIDIVNSYIHLLLSMGKTRDAIAHFELYKVRVTERTYNNLIQGLIERDQLTDARRYYRECMQKFPTSDFVPGCFFGTYSPKDYDGALRQNPPYSNSAVCIGLVRAAPDAQEINRLWKEAIAHGAINTHLLVATLNRLGEVRQIRQMEALIDQHIDLTDAAVGSVMAHWYILNNDLVKAKRAFERFDVSIRYREGALDVHKLSYGAALVATLLELERSPQGIRVMTGFGDKDHFLEMKTFLLDNLPIYARHFNVQIDLYDAARLIITPDNAPKRRKS